MFKSLMNSLSSAWGLKETKVIALTYEEAKSRLTESEYGRLIEAFSRVAVHNSHITKQVFCRDVLGELFPSRIAEFIFISCGGSARGLTFRDLVVILVLLTKGTQQEKIRFIFSLYSQDNTAISRDDFIRFTEEVEGISVPEVSNKLFYQSNNVEYDIFSTFLRENPNFTSISSWLLGHHCGLEGRNPFKLTDDHDTPTFYQTLAGVTHLEEEDIIELEKRYWVLQSNARTGKMDVTTLLPLISPPLPTSTVQGFLDAFDENRDGHIDFKEMACGISAAARGPTIERQKFCFKVFDEDKDGVLSKNEVHNMIQVMRSVVQETLPEPPSEELNLLLAKDDKIIVEDIFGKIKGNEMTLVEYLEWSLMNQLPEHFLSLIYQICQIIFGLKPLTPSCEYELVTSWLRREEKRGRQVDQIWYLVSMEWWHSWLNYVNPNPMSSSNSDSGVGSIIGSIGSQSNSISNFSDNNNCNGTLVSSSAKERSSSNSRCWSMKKSNIESTVAIDLSQNVVVTGINSYDMDTDQGTLSPSTLSPHTKSSSSSLSLMTLDSSRSTCSSSPSPVSSPSTVRRQLTSTSLNGLGHTPSGRKRKPEAIDNSYLINPIPDLHKVPSLTSEGGRLRPDLEEGKDFKAIPQALWTAFHQWYGATLSIPRQVIAEGKIARIELYPITLILYRHQLNVNGATGKPLANPGNGPWTGMAGMYGGAALSTTMSFVQNHSLSPPKRILSFTATFSRNSTLEYIWNFIANHLRIPAQDIRLDLLSSDQELSFICVLEEENSTLEELGVKDMSRILIEVRNKDQTWPEEIGSLASTGNEQLRLRRNPSIAVEKGLTGLNNLGNTCFMNSAIQCVSNTVPLTMYFRRRMHMYELNRTNPLGMKGHIAKKYGDLINEIWSGTTKTIAPLKLRFTIGKYAPRFSGFQQNDAQELLAFLLDGLHEDLNRVTEKPYVELKDSDNRPDVVCAQEAWENHLLRNKSIVVDLFHGQLKSSVRCKVCNHESVRFDPFNYLSLPLPMESFVLCDIVVIRQNGTVPVRYGILVTTEEYVSDVKTKLSVLTGTDGYQQIPPDHLLLVQIQNYKVNLILKESERVKSYFTNRIIYAFQVVSTEDELSSLNGSPQTNTDHQIQKILSSSKNILRPPSENDHYGPPTHSRQSSYSSSSTGSSSIGNGKSTMSSLSSSPPEGYMLVVHRKMIRQEMYFVSTQKARPVLFGLPLVVPYHEGMTHLDLYRRVWSLVARLVTPLPPDGPNIYNHAQDCDDSLGYEYPFVLRLVSRDSEWCCGKCLWHDFCRGCSIMCSEYEKLDKIDPNICAVAVDWDPTAVHLRYQTTHEYDCVDHPSLSAAIKRQSESVALQTCLDNFTKEEELTEDEKYYCAKCKTHQLAVKKLQIWRLPPFLIVHLKRFQAVNSRWIKSNKIVDFPFKDFDPSEYLADVPKKTSQLARSNQTDIEMLDSGDSTCSSLFPLQDFHQHRLIHEADPFNLNYRLYAIVNHTGIMGGGHYFSYARSPDGKWHCFNDSSCKEIQEDHIDKANAYMLFYERTDLESDAYMPRIDPRAVPVTDEELDAEESEFKKLCLL